MVEDYPDQPGDKLPDHFAVVYAPRQGRPRFPENIVYLKASAEQAMAEAEPDNKLYAARVCGPSKSSEGLMIYYLREWLS